MCSVLAFAAVALLSASPEPEAAEEIQATGDKFSDSLPVMVEEKPVGPPLPLTGVASISLCAAALLKLPDPVGADLDERA
mmetsp:Transcript_47269/g.148504  ORF Transcript_47269/g.148504 Transcript_47269/m.148504 type:complete len:80 (-) Transcript_47269:66-305(-)